ncbi:MAG: CHAT domain-containing tetratricopeptide repeat protein, partial [Salinivenus sp.]
MLDVSGGNVSFLSMLIAACLLGGLPLEEGRARPAGEPQEPVPSDTTVVGQRADSLLAAADSLRERREVAAAMRRYRQALALYRRVGDREGQADAKNEIGILHAYQDRRERALSTLEEALQMYRELGRRAEAAKCLNNIAILHKRDGSYEEALQTYRDALQTFRALDDKRSQAVALSNMGLVHEQQGDFRQSLDMHEKALEMYRAIDDRAGVARSLDNVGDIQVTQGQYREALANFREALQVHRALGNRRKVAGAHNGIGRVQFWRYQYDEALSSFRKAIRMHREVGDRSAIAANLNDVGLVYQKQGRYEQAETVLKKALRIHRDIEDRYSTATTLQILGDIERARQNYDEALPRYREALRINRALENSSGVAKNLDGIGNLRLTQGRLAVADSILRQSVQLTEQLLRTATGAERRDFLAKEIDRFQALVTTQVRAGRPEAALRTLERSRARLLTERLSDDSSSASPAAIPSVDSLRHTLARHEAAVLYANTDTERPLTAFVVTRQSVQVREVQDSMVLRDARRRYESALERLRLQEELAMDPTQGASLLRRAKGVRVGLGTEGTLANLIRLYRHDLSARPEAQILVPERRRRLGQVLYDLLVAPLDAFLATKEELLVVPDGALNYLPFEALSDRAGAYLIDRWRVRYVQSLRTLHLLQARDDPAGRSASLLALGGVAYNSGADTSGERSTPSGTRVQGRAAGEQARKDGYRRLDRGGDPVEGYRRLGFGPDRWQNLPGTLEEVRALGRIATRSTLLVGAEASERTLTQLSRTGRLAEHRALHFATHGFVVPERPELSALVLSEVGQLSASSSAEEGDGLDSTDARGDRPDGYLSMREIVKLDLNAEFVGLSACRTGLGRIYRG